MRFDYIREAPRKLGFAASTSPAWTTSSCARGRLPEGSTVLRFPFTSSWVPASVEWPNSIPIRDTHNKFCPARISSPSTVSSLSRAALPKSSEFLRVEWRPVVVARFGWFCACETDWSSIKILVPEHGPALASKLQRRLLELKSCEGLQPQAAYNMSHRAMNGTLKNVQWASLSHLHKGQNPCVTSLA